ncbi:unnamed protein product [Leuciscus chuanchicus]
MVLNCFVPGCTAKTRKGQAVSFHHLPVKHLERGKQWLRAIKHPKFGEDTDLENLKNQRVCSRHFKQEDYEPNVLGMKRTTLKDTAIPSIFTFPDDEQPGPSGTKRIRLETHNTEISRLRGHEGGKQDKSKQLRSTRHTIIKMAFIKEESEEIKIEEASSVKQEETEEQTKMAFIKVESEEMKIESFIVKQEDTEEQTKMEFIIEESEEMKIEEAFVVKQEDTEEQTKMAFIKEESEDMKIEEAFTEEQTAGPSCGQTLRSHDQTNNNAAFKQRWDQVTHMPVSILPYQFEPESDPENADDQVDESEPPLQARLQQNVSQWCRCENCNRMPSEVENVCCMEIPKVLRRMNQVSGPLKCMTHHPGFEPNCLNPYTLQNILNIYRADYGNLRRRTEEGRYRYLAHRSFVSWCWGYLGRKIRVVLPSCVVLRIQQEFPDPDGQFVGFRPPLD